MASVPQWVKQVDDALRALSQRVPLLATATPANAREERVRLVDLASRGCDATPHWRYAPLDTDAICAQLRAIYTWLGRSEDDPLADLYRARIRELELEARLCACVGTPRAGELAVERFGTGEGAALELATAWTSEAPPPPSRADAVLTDDPHPDSLLSLMRAEVGRRQIPFAVVVHPHLSALAATGNQTVFVAAGRRIGLRAARRTVLHEIEGHVLPRVHAAGAPIRLLAIGTAGGTDEQEGYALWLEERGGFLDAARRRELGGRYLAVRAMQRGTTFAETVHQLTRAHGVAARDAVVMAERAFRGSDGTFPGLGRERVYLTSYLRVRAHLERAPEDEAVLASGQVSLDALETIRPYAAWSPG